MQVTGAVSWRREGLRYKKNEVYLDIVESVNVLMTAKGAVLRSDVSGKVLMKCFLSVRPACLRLPSLVAHAWLAQGMPELKLGLNDHFSAEGAGEAPASTSIPSFGGGSPGGASSGYADTDCSWLTAS